MAKYFWLLIPVFIFIALLPNYCFASTISGLKIEEVKTRGLNISSTAAKWLEIANVSGAPINLQNICLASSPDKISTTAPKNCFPNINLNPLQTAIVAYSGDAFLADNDLTFSQISNPFFELGGFGTSFADDPNIPDLISVYKTSFLNITNGQIILYDKTDGSIIDQLAWASDQGTANSLQRPVYDGVFDFVDAAPTPFSLLPEFVTITPQKIDFTDASFQISRINDPNKLITEKFSLWQNGQKIQEQDGNLSSLTFNSLMAGMDYQLQFSGCETTTNFCFNSSQNFTTKQTYPKILINEIYPAPDTSKGEQEWFELYNPGAANLDLTGWQARDRSGHILDLSGVILANNYLVFYPASKLSLNNDGDQLNLSDPNGDSSDRVTYPAALAQFSYSRFGNSFSWSRKNTPDQENVLVPQYLSQIISQIPNQENQVQVSGKVIMAPGDFAKTYFYINDASFALKITSSSELNFNRNQCFSFLGTINPGEEKYLALDNYQILANCNSITTVAFINPSSQTLESLIDRLIKLNGEIYTQNSSYFINYQGYAIKLRANFKLYKGNGTVQGILSRGDKYWQLFMVESSWFQVQSLAKSSAVIKIKLVAPPTKAILASAIVPAVKAAAYQPLVDYRTNNQTSNPLNYYFLFCYYLAIIIFASLAKILVFS
jgi:hypothetical protein